MLEADYINTCNLMRVRTAVDALSELICCPDYDGELREVMKSLSAIREDMVCKLIIQESK